MAAGLYGPVEDSMAVGRWMVGVAPPDTMEDASASMSRPEVVVVAGVRVGVNRGVEARGGGGGTWHMKLYLEVSKP